MEKTLMSDYKREWSAEFDQKSGGNFMDNVSSYVQLASNLKEKTRIASDSYNSYVSILEEEINAWASREEHSRRESVEDYLDEPKMKKKLFRKMIISSLVFIVGLVILIFGFTITETTPQTVLMVILTITYIIVGLGILFMHIIIGEKSIETITERFDDMAVITMTEYREKESELWRKNATNLKELDRISVWSKELLKDLETLPMNPYSMGKEGQLAVMRRMQIEADGAPQITRGDLPEVPEKFSTIDPHDLYLPEHYRGNVSKDVELAMVDLREFVEELSVSIVLHRLNLKADDTI